MQGMTSQGRIDFLKLDIEGQEKFVLEDQESWPALCKVRCMAAEVHDRIEPGCSTALANFLAVCGFSLRLPTLACTLLLVMWPTCTCVWWRWPRCEAFQSLTPSMT